ncbi:MAG TPA: TRAP transporter large permease, partial [Beijerinckiaceae bacterium]|nr:TRAP transporter large permease [Beijerinckiaceae bacterium]
MSPAAQGGLVLVVTVLAFMTGAPVAFALGAVGIGFLVLFQGFDSLRVAAETLYSGLHDFTLVSIPMFVMMGAAIGSSPAGRDLYIALDRWLYRVPGGLVISNLGACALFAALTGSSPATCAAIGKMGIPEMRRRGYPDAVATGSICAGGTLGILIPPSITFILYGIATETSIGRLFLAGVLPGLLLTALFMLWTLFYIWRSGFRAYAPDFRYSWKEKFQSIPKVAPFLLIVIGVMYVLYGGVATPSEAAGVGAALCVILAVIIYRMWQARDWWQILRDTTRESVMILMIIAAAVLFGYMLTSLYLTQTLATAIADMHVNRWVLMALINVFLLVCGFFIPPAAI